MTDAANPRKAEASPGILFRTHWGFEPRWTSVVPNHLATILPPWRNGLLNSDEPFGFVHQPSGAVRPSVFAWQSGKTKAALLIIRINM
ncbi:MAG TPA: hypothetical protein VGG46_02970 [Terriglobales bacterium]|jgi:hypothetical protein